MFVEKNQNIYEGIEASDIKVTLKENGDGAGGGVARSMTGTGQPLLIRGQCQKSGLCPAR